MTALKRQAIDVLGVAVGVVLGGAVLGAAYRGSGYLPLVDAWLYPVVRFEGTTNIGRVARSEEYTTGRVCFTLNIVKLTDGQPQPYRFFVNTPLSAEIPLAVELADEHDLRLRKQVYDKHPVGARWGRRYCAELPGTVTDDDELTVTGFGYHRRHPFWVTQTPVPAFVIAPTS